MNSNVVMNIILYISLQLCTISMYILYKPMLTKLMNYIEIINEILIIISIYFMMIFTNWIDDIELRYSLGFSLIHVILFVVCCNMVVIVYYLKKDIYKKYKEYKYNNAWEEHNKNMIKK